MGNALVTGGAVRIGSAICEALVAAGYGVVIHCRHSGRAARELAGRLAAAGGRAWVVRGPLGGEGACRAILSQAWAASGGCTVLVNNAAVFHKHRLMDLTERRLMDELWPNAISPVLLTRLFAQRLAAGASRGRGGPVGRVVNLLDRRITGHEPGCPAYLLSKKMLADFTRAAALELAPRVTVNAVAPGAILPPAGARGRVAREWAGPVPLRRRCTPQDVAEAVLFLLRSDAVTGQVLFVDGGQHLRGTTEA